MLCLRTSEMMDKEVSLWRPDSPINAINAWNGPIRFMDLWIPPKSSDPVGLV